MSKLHWKMVTLGAVADNSTAATKDPFGEGYTRYVIGKHIPTDKSKITTWNEVGDGEFGSRIRTMFRAGDIICTTRGPNLRVAVPDFDGLSAHTNFILRTKDTNLLLQKYLEYVVTSDGFQNHLKLNFRGSTNLFVNWSDAAKYEFPLPPVDEQRHIAELLWAADEVISNNQDLLEKIYLLKRTATHNFTRSSKTPKKLKATEFGKLPENWNVEPLGNLLENVQYGLSKPLHEKGDYPVFRMMNIIDGKMAANDMKYIDLPDGEFETYKVNNGDILFNRTNSADLVGKLGIFDLVGNYVFASYLIRLVAKQDVVLPEYLNYYLNSDEGQRRISSFATPGVSQTNINASNLQRVLVPVPPIDEQMEFVSQLNQIDSSKEEIIGHIENSQKLKKQLLTKFLGNT